MSTIAENFFYTKDHEWVSAPEGGKVKCGITDHAQEMLTDIVFVELPEVGREVVKGDLLGVVESVKAVSDVYSPVSGTVSAINESLEDSPELVNSEPYDGGWIVEIALTDESEVEELMNAQTYGQHSQGE